MSRPPLNSWFPRAFPSSAKRRTKKHYQPGLEALEDRSLPSLFAVVPLSSLNGANGFTVSGRNDNDFTGDVTAVGDINGDGLDDFAVGAGFADAGGNNRGQVSVIFGRNTGFPTNLSLAALGSADGFTLNGEADSDYAGASIRGAGDVNGDGVDDLIIGAALANAAGTDRGRAYVVFGSSRGFPSEIDLDNLNGSTGFILNGVLDGDQAGSAVAGAGDVNGDGFDDILIGAQHAKGGGLVGSQRGEAYVVFGKNTPFAATFNLNGLNGSNGFILNGIADADFAGAAVAGAGDVNGDNIDDMVVGAFHANIGGTLRGQSYVIFGKNTPFAATLNLSSLNGTTGFILNGIGDSDVAGRSVAGAGDVNGDGFDDVLIGAQKASGGGTKRGQAYVIFGKNTAFASPLVLSSLNGVNGFAINGISNGDYAGTEVAGVGDVNGDGLDDVLTSAPNVGAGGTNRGQAYVVFGSKSAFAATLSLSTLNGINGFTLNGVADGDRLFDVARAGDVNGDGMDDLLLSANQADAGGTDRGEQYVVFGRSNLVAVGPDLGAAPLVRVLRPDGTLLRELLPYPITFSGGVRVAVGDLNGDGQPDVLTAPGSGLVAQVRAFDGHTGQPLASLPNGVFPYGTTYSKGLFIAAGDTNGNGGSEIIVSPSGGAAKPVRVFDVNGVRLASFFPYGSTYTGGVKVAAGDVAAGAEAEIVTVRNTSSSLVKVFSGTGVQIGSSFAAFPGAGAFIAVGNTDGVGKAEIIAGAVKGQPATVRFFTAAGVQQGSFTAYAGFTGGVRVGAVDVNGDGRADFVTGPAKGLIARVKVFNAATLLAIDDFLAYDDEFNLGVFVAAG